MKTLKIEIPKGYEIDKEKSTFTNIIFKPIEKKYVDLGLPSGTLWCDTNEEGYYTWDEACQTFGSKLPKLTDWAELYDYCKWKWDSMEKGMIVTGPNGNSIFLPASGYRDYSGGGLGNVGSNGYYWSASPYGGGAYYLYFGDSGSVLPSSNYNRAYGQSVRCLQESK